MVTQIITIGDSVRHKTLLINGNVPMNVLDVKDNQAFCDYFDNDEDQTNKQKWFDLVNLEKVIYG